MRLEVGKTEDCMLDKMYQEDCMMNAMCKEPGCG